MSTEMRILRTPASTALVFLGAATLAALVAPARFVCAEPPNFDGAWQYGLVEEGYRKLVAEVHKKWPDPKQVEWQTGGLYSVSDSWLYLFPGSFNTFLQWSRGQLAPQTCPIPAPTSSAIGDERKPVQRRPIRHRSMPRGRQDRERRQRMRTLRFSRRTLLAVLSSALLPDMAGGAEKAPPPEGPSKP